MSARQLISELRQLGVTVTPSGERLSVSAPPGVLTPALRERLTSHKQELMTLLRPAPGPFPLTDIQQAYLVGRSAEMPLGSVGCHFYREFENTGLDPVRLERAWRRVIERHPMLRAVFEENGTQRILEIVPEWRLQIDNCRGMSPSEADARVLATREAMAHGLFDPASWPLFDIRLTLLGDGRQRIHFGFDLLAADAVGIRRLLDDWFRFYEEPHAVAAASGFSFRDYVLALRREEESAEFQADLHYWTARLPQLPGPPELPLALAPERMPTPRFSRREATLDAATWSGLQRRAAAWQITPSTLICAAFAETLGRWSRKRAITLTLTHFQTLPQFRDVVGDFTSTLLLAFSASACDFRGRAVDLQRQLAEDLNHSRVSGVRALRECGSKADLPPYGFPVVFTSALGHRGGAGPAWLGRTLYTLTETPQVWLDHVVVEESGRLVLSWDAVEDLFQPGLLDDMFAAEGRLLEALAGDTEEFRYWVFSHAQREERALWNQTGAPAPCGLLHEPFVRSAEAQPDRPALIDCERTLTYGELHQQAGRLAMTLVKQGVRPGDRVAILMEKGWRQIAAVLGAGYCGAVYVPIDPESPEVRIRKLLGRVEPAAVLRDVEYRDSGDLWTPLTAGSARTDLDPAYIIFTSGSTGEPKGVAIGHRGAHNTIDDVNTRCRVAASDRVLSLSGLHFDLSVYDIFGILGSGGTVVLPDPCERLNPNHWNGLVARHGVTIWNTVPALLRMALDALAPGSEDLYSLRCVLLSGDWIPPTLIDEARPLAPRARFIGMGGATEASIWSIWHDIEGSQPGWPSIPYGRPMRNQTFQILDSEMEPCPTWTPGQLYIGGVGLALEYWRDPERTALQFIAHPSTGERLYATGDLGRYRPGGVIEFLGREDRQVKIQGHRIELGEIEAAICRHPRVDCALAVAKGDAFGPRRLVAYVVGSGISDGWRPPADSNMLLDPGERLAKRLSLHRASGSGPADVELPAVAHAPSARRTVRSFSTEPVPRIAVSGLLACLRPSGVNAAGLPLFLYPSAGHLYQVSAYLYCRPQRVESLHGFYRYLPEHHGLSSVGDPPVSLKQWHVAPNRALFEESAFSLFLAANVEAVRSIYGSMARDLCLLEAGYIGQSIMLAAAEHGLGLCAIGAMDTPSLSAALGLAPGQEILHSFVGGLPRTGAGQSDSPDYVTPGAVTPAAVRAFLQRELPAYMVPANIVVLDSFPLNANGKVDRAALPDPAAGIPAEPRPSDGVTVSWLTGIVKDILGGAPVDPFANFFDLGATSLHLVQLARRLEDEGRRIPIADLFRNPSVMALAGQLSAPERNSDAVRQGALDRGRARRAARRPTGGAQ